MKTLTKQEILERVAKAKKMREAADYKPVILIPAIFRVDDSNDSKGYKYEVPLSERINNPGYAEYLPYSWERD